MALHVAQVGGRKIARLINLPYSNDFEVHLGAAWCRTEEGVLIQVEHDWILRSFTRGVDNWGIWCVAPERSYDGGGTTYVLLASNEQTGVLRDQLMRWYKTECDRQDEEARLAYEEEQRSREDVGVRQWCEEMERRIIEEETHGKDPLPDSTTPQPE